MRDREFQAVLSVDSEVPKIKHASLYRILDSETLKSLIAALGVGIKCKGIEDSEFLSHLRYGQIVLAFDATPEGEYIRTQIVTFLHRFNYMILEAEKVSCISRTSIPDIRTMTEEEIATAIFNKETRQLIQLRAGRTIDSTLSQLS
jgi:DNA gyrase/topoisomerase IV subunit B